MIECKVCKRKFNDFIGLGVHYARTHKIKSLAGRIARRCLNCEVEFISLKCQNKRLCSKKCANIYNGTNRKGKKRLETGRHISKALTGRKLSKSHIENVRKAILGTKYSKERLLNYQKRKWSYKDTSIELKLQQALKEVNVKFRTHESILGRPDIFIEPNLCIFADGDYWHNLPGRKEYDDNISHKLRRQGHSVLRFWEHDINQTIKKCIDKIQKHLYQYKEYYLDSMY